jgi:hypothetical protein
MSRSWLQCTACCQQHSVGWQLLRKLQGIACVTLKLRSSCDKAAHSSVNRQPCLLH